MTGGKFDVCWVIGEDDRVHIDYEEPSYYAAVQVPTIEVPTLIHALSAFLRETCGPGKADAETGDFIASNGLRVTQDAVGGVGVTWAAPQNAGWTLHDTQETAALREYFLSQLFTDDALRAMVSEVYGPHEPADWELGNVRSAVLAALAVPAPAVGDKTVVTVPARIEYGYRREDVHGRDLGVMDTSRTPDRWLDHMGTPYSRLVVEGRVGEWQEEEDAVIYLERDSRPWLRPGADPTSRPAENRSESDEGGWEFSPRPGYDDDMEAYGFLYADCGRTGKHWPHGAITAPGVAASYCDGVPR
ncbi:hypothetical protein [Microbacterium sp. 77mftsu3.1]|uniref:hypothetical protein n=1 Tax=Microbacterium sp. 77mftsu3.1 TaxID=1761802 RepID=UPI00037C1560|nr:hypothetical protein [Microbacterium sp. 77mftsu3.1]SDH43536.1 hypothetical protein SAMN04488590_3339 [Microbacterium sp. 77mftsu3.1]